MKSDLKESGNDIVRGLYKAYVEGPKGIVGGMLSENFTFSSPRDDHIDRNAYLDRFWLQPPFLRGMEIEFLAIDEAEAVVRYCDQKS